MGTYVIKSSVGYYFAEIQTDLANVCWVKGLKDARRFNSSEDLDAACWIFFRVPMYEARKRYGMRVLKLVPNRRKAAREALLAAALEYRRQIAPVRARLMLDLPGNVSAEDLDKLGKLTAAAIAYGQCFDPKVTAVEVKKVG